MSVSAGRIAVLIAIAAACLLHFAAGNLYIDHLDEGIYLEGAARIASGDVIYRDFFALTGPGTYWIVSALFQLLGTTLAAARWAPFAALGVLTGAVYYLTARLTGRVFAALVTFAYFGFMIANTDMMVVNHRLDSASLSALAIACSIAGWPAAAGFAAAAAAWTTPPMLALCLAMLVWHWRGASLKPFAAGIAACSLPAALWLASQSALVPMIDHLLWSSSNYSGANRAFYGFLVGGWAALFTDASGAELLIRAVFIGYCLMLPAALPVAALAASALRLWRSREEWFLALCGAALIASTYPRPGVTNLRYLSAIFVVLAASLVYRAGRWRKPLLAAPLVLSFMLLWTAVQTLRSGTVVETARGSIRVSPKEAPALRAWLRTVPSGAPSFAFPYQPIAMFLAASRNPSRYNYLQPGMMTASDEAAVLAAFEKNPPEWVLHASVPPSAYLRIWPASDPARLHMPRLEAFLARRYQTSQTIEEQGMPVRILRLTAQ